MDRDHDVKQLDWEGQDLELKRHNSGMPGISTKAHPEYSDYKESQRGIKGSGISLRKRSLGEGSDYAESLGNKLNDAKGQLIQGQPLKMIKMEDESQYQSKAKPSSLVPEIRLGSFKNEDEDCNDDELAEILDTKSQAEASFNALDDFIDPMEKEEMFEFKDEE